MRRTLSLLLSVILCITCFSSAASAEERTVAVSLDTIENLMLQNSVDLQKIKADLDKLSGDYSETQSMVNSLKEQNAAAPDPSVTAQYNAAKSNRDAAQIAYLTVKMQYDKLVMLQVLNTKQLYLTCTVDMRQAEVTAKQLENKRAEMAAYDVKLTLGLVTKNEYDAAVLDLKMLEDRLNSDKQKADSGLSSLKTALGIDASDEVAVLPASFDETVFSLIPSINFDEDSADMLQNNVNVKAKEAALEILMGAAIKKRRNINVAKVELMAANNTAVQDFQSQYDALTDAYRSYDTASQALKISEEAAENGRMLYQYGYCSKLVLNDLELNESMAELSQTVQKNALYCIYLRYIQMRNGN